MNNLFKKIAVMTVGLTMAIGVGVAVSRNSDFRAAEAATAWQAHTGSLTAGNQYLIVAVSGSYCMKPANTSTSGTTTTAAGGYSAVSFTAASGPDFGFVFADAGSGKFYIKDGTTFVRANGTTNNGLCSAANNNTNPNYGIWTVTETGTSGQYTIINENTRQISLYNNSNWRSYGTNSGSKTNVKIYEKATTPQTITASATEAYSDESVTLTTNATSATWSITSGGSYGHLSSTSGKSVSLIGDAAGSVTVKAAASGYTDATKTITFTERPAGTYYDVTFNSNGGSISPAKESIKEDETFTFPSPGTKAHYSFLGWSSDGGSTKYATGATSPAVVADITYTAYWQEDAKVTVTYSAGEHATGSYSHTNQYVGSYSLLAFNSLSGITYDSTVYRFKNYTVGGVNKNPGDSITLSAATTVTVNFEEIPLEYQVVFGTNEGTTGITDDDWSKGGWTIPSEVTLDNITGNVYGNTTGTGTSLRFGKGGTTGSFDASITGNYYIASVKCNLKYYGSDTTATFAVTPNGGSAISKSLTGSWADYTYDVSAAKAKKVTLGTDVNGKRAFLSGFTITYAPLKALSNIALSGTYPTTFTKGDTFSHSGMVVTANYSDSTSVNVTSSATWSSPDMSTTGVKTITVSYSDEYGSASQTYSITVNYAAPTSITLSHNSGTVALEETFDVSTISVTINPSATADQTAYAWSLYDDGGLVEDVDYVWISPQIMSYTAGTFIFRCTSTEDGTKYAEFTLTVSGEPLAQLKDKSDNDVTNGSMNVYNDAGTISYSVVAENFQGTLTYTWASSNTSIISIDAEADEICDYYVEGVAGSSRLSCRIQGSIKGDVTVYVDVTVVAAQVTSVSWDAPTIDVFSGATLSSSDTSSWNVKVSYDSGRTDVTPPSFDVKLGGSIISLPYTWQGDDNGKTLGVSVDGVDSSTTSVTITQTINNVNAPITSAWDYTFEAKVWSAAGAQTLDGKSWTMSGTDDGSPYFGYDATKGQQFGSGTHPYSDVSLQSSAFSGTIDSVTIYTSGANSIDATVQVSVGGTAYGTAKTITNTNTAYTFDLGGKSGTVSIDWVNSSSKAIYVKEIVVNTVTSSQNIANNASHKAAQRVAVKFAKAFNSAMDDTEYCTTGLSAAWATCTAAYNTFKTEAAALGSTEEAYAKNLIKYATVRYTDDSGEACIERMMKTYEVCVSEHGQTAFMSELVSVNMSKVTPLVNVVGNSNMIVIIVTISVISLAAIGGYFLLRKKKEI